MLSSGRNAVFAQNAAGYTPGAGSELIVLTTPVDEKHQQLVVIDPKQRGMSVYHVELDSGEIALKSVRQLHWDLQLMEYNGVKPLPREIRQMLQVR